MKILKLEDFKSEQDRKDHFDRHGDGFSSPEEYEARANEIAMSIKAGLVGSSSEWWVYNTKDRKTVKYNQVTGELCAYRRIMQKDQKSGYDSPKNVEISSLYSKTMMQFISELRRNYKNSPLAATKRASEEDIQLHKEFLTKNKII